MNGPIDLSEVLRLAKPRRLPEPMPPALASARRSMIVAAECAALADVSGDDFDLALHDAREAFRAKANQISNQKDQSIEG